jgi:hypothetical protein
VGPSVRPGKRKGKRGSAPFFGSKVVGPAQGPTRPGLTQTGQLGLRLSRPARAHVLARRGRPARLSRPAHGLFPPPFSLSDTAGPGGSAPFSARQAGPPCRSPIGSGVAEDPVRLGPMWFYVHVVRVCVCVCVCGMHLGRVQSNARKGLAATRTRRRGVGAWSPRTAKLWWGRGVAAAG